MLWHMRRSGLLLLREIDVMRTNMLLGRRPRCVCHRCGVGHWRRDTRMHGMR